MIERSIYGAIRFCCFGFGYHGLFELGRKRVIYWFYVDICDIGRWLVETLGYMMIDARHCTKYL